MTQKKVKLKVDEGQGLGDREREVDLPGNSNKEKREKKVDKVIKGTVQKKKKSLGKRVANNLMGEDDVQSVTNYILYDVVIPAAKNTISEMVSGGIEMLLFGERKGSRTRRDRGRSYVSYDSYHNRRDPRDPVGRGHTQQRTLSRRARTSHNFDDLILSSRGDAEEVLSHLVDLIEDYGMATVADLYDLVDVTAAYTDSKYGWDNLSTASVVRVRGGYLIKLPKTRVLD